MTDAERKTALLISASILGARKLNELGWAERGKPKYVGAVSSAVDAAADLLAEVERHLANEAAVTYPAK